MHLSTSDDAKSLQKHCEVKITTNLSDQSSPNNRKDSRSGGREVYNDDGLTAGSSDMHRVAAVASGDVF